MKQLAFVDDDRHFDGTCVRFTGRHGEQTVVCGVTIYALQHCDPGLPRHGLIGAEHFLSAFDKLITEVHHAARCKFEKGDFEPAGPVRIMIHRHDLAP